MSLYIQQKVVLGVVCLTCALLEVSADEKVAAEMVAGESVAAEIVAEEKVAGESVAGEVRLRLNFKHAPVSAVLNYLSQAAGFIIVGDAVVPGEVDLISHRPLNRTEAVELLNSVISTKGFTAIVNDRFLKIVDKTSAKAQDLPVLFGKDVSKIPKTDNMVTQIIPVINANADELLKNLEPLLAEYSNVTSNKGSNALLVTDTQRNIYRIAEIVNALDKSASAVNTIRVYKLLYADPKQTEIIINKLFKDDSNSSGGQKMSEWMSRMRGRGGKGASEQQRTSATVTAVSDAHTNSLVINAPEELLAEIDALLSKLDTPSEEELIVKIFPLDEADPREVVTAIKTHYGTSTSGGSKSKQKSKSKKPQSKSGLSTGDVKVTEDIRSNSVVVSASKHNMDLIAALIEKLDQTIEKEQKLQVFPLKYADPSVVSKAISSLLAKSRSSRGGRNTKSTTSGSKSLIEGEISVVADLHSNSVAVTASENDLILVANLIAQLDIIEDAAPQVFVYKIENADLEALREKLEELYGSSRTKPSRSKTSRSFASSRTASRKNNSKSKKR